jgi:hypothetical protein
MLRAPRFGGWLYTEHPMRPRRLALLSILAALALAAASVGVAAASGMGQGNGLVASGAIDSMRIYTARGGPFGGGGGSNPNLVSHGGAIQTTPKVYISWWGSQWNTGFSTGGYTSGQAQQYVTDFFNSVGGSAWNGVVTQYCQGIASGTSDCTGKPRVGNQVGMLAGTWVDTTAVPSKPKQSDIANAAKRLMGQFGYDPNATYFVFTPSGRSMSGFKTTWCAWHSSTSTTSGTLAYAYMPYIPDAGANCGMNFVNKTNNAYGNGYFDGFSIVGGHEFSEAETDPFPSSGWTDSGGSENADKCAWSSMSTNITLGSNAYAVQPTWSNAITGCSNG